MGPDDAPLEERVNVDRWGPRAVALPLEECSASWERGLRAPRRLAWAKPGAGSAWLPRCQKPTVRCHRARETCDYPSVYSFEIPIRASRVNGATSTPTPFAHDKVRRQPALELGAGLRSGLRCWAAQDLLARRSKRRRACAAARCGASSCLHGESSRRARLVRACPSAVSSVASVVDRAQRCQLFLASFISRSST